jgi:hypothetical protein
MNRLACDLEPHLTALSPSSLFGFQNKIRFCLTPSFLRSRICLAKRFVEQAFSELHGIFPSDLGQENSTETTDSV